MSMFIFKATILENQRENNHISMALQVNSNHA